MNRDFPGRELTLRGLALGVALTLPFTAANIYLGLKVGLTFATSIPAAVISMALLGLLRDSSIRENNIVQTVTSAAGTMASIIFVLPGLVIVGFWTGFPFWMSFLLTLAGGVLGVMFTIPLRRALVTNSDLPYPEGVAGAEVLRVGSGRRDGNPEAREGLLAVVYGALASAGLAIAVSMRLAIDGASGYFRLPWGASGFSFAWSLALFGAGHLVGLSVGLAMALGIAIGWLGAVPILASMTPQHLPLGDFVNSVWSSQVRYVGAGAMGVAAIWSLLRMIRPILGGLAQVARSAPATADPRDHTDRDIPIGWIAGLSALATALAAGLTWRFAADAGLGSTATAIALVTIPIITLFGFLVAAICGYMAGLIGSSNSPVSGVGILAVTGCSVLLAVFFAHAPAHALVAVALFITAILFAAACSSNDNLQDLKTGQLVGAAPWRQQVALLIGVSASAIVVPLVLNLLAQAYGFAGAANLNIITAQPLAAPQANLIAALAQGVISRNISWNLIGAGALVGLAIVALDELARARGWLRVPPLAVGFGIYLPMSATLPVVMGALAGWFYNHRTRTGPAMRLGVLVASGLIVGESLYGVINAGLIVGAGSDAPLALVPAGFAAAPLLAVLGFGGLIVLLYGWLFKMASRA